MPVCSNRHRSFPKAQHCFAWLSNPEESNLSFRKSAGQRKTNCFLIKPDSSMKLAHVKVGLEQVSDGDKIVDSHPILMRERFLSYKWGALPNLAPD
jgi:hypothetical protein